MNDLDAGLVSLAAIHEYDYDKYQTAGHSDGHMTLFAFLLKVVGWFNGA